MRYALNTNIGVLHTESAPQMPLGSCRRFRLLAHPARSRSARAVTRAFDRKTILDSTAAVSSGSCFPRLWWPIMHVASFCMTLATRILKADRACHALWSGQRGCSHLTKLTPNPSLERTRGSVVGVRLTPSLACVGAHAAQFGHYAP